MRLTVVEPAADATAPTVRSTLMLPVGASRHLPTDWGVTVVLSAARPGAFVDLAAYLAYLLGVPLGEVRLDAHLPAGGQGAEDGSTLARRSLVNQAVGLLVGRGLSPQEAWADLDTRASACGRPRWAAAERLLAETGAAGS